jgi:hypothetical protein
MTKKLLKLALDALEKAKRQCQYHNIAPHLIYDEAIAAIKEALAQPEQEPVAKVIDWGVEGPRLQGLTNDWPVVGTLLYTTPPQRTWVGLTDKEIDSYFEDQGWSPSKDYYPVIKAIEAKLKEHNT